MWNTKEYSIIELLELHEFGLCWLRITDEMARGIGMLKSVCVKNPDAITLRDCFGATALSTVNGLCTVFMSSMFMQYMTTLATSLLLFARIFDAVDDPVQGFLMDRGKRTKKGSFRFDNGCRQLHCQSPGGAFGCNYWRCAHGNRLQR